MSEPNSDIMPPSVELSFFYKDEAVCSVPVYLLVLLAKKQGVSEDSEPLNNLQTAADHIVQNKLPNFSPEDAIRFFQKNILWTVLKDYLSCHSFFIKEFGKLWNEKEIEKSFFTIRLEQIPIPSIVYRYMPFHPDRIPQLLADGKLFLPCPAMFNDPFDCSLDESIRMTFIESAIGCFTTIPDNVLMFSHYADSHRGLCVGFNTEKFVKSLTSKNHPFQASIRPVGYFSRMPGLSLSDQPALCATCKSNIWSYENEFRIFMVKGESLVASNLFTYDREAITEIIFGCKTTDENIAQGKSLVQDLVSCRQRKAVKILKQFGINLEKIHNH